MKLHSVNGGLRPPEGFHYPWRHGERTRPACHQAPGGRRWKGFSSFFFFAASMPEPPLLLTKRLRLCGNTAFFPLLILPPGLGIPCSICGSDLTWCPLLWIDLPSDPFVFVPYFLHREDKMRILGNLTLSFHLLLKRLHSNSGLTKGFLSSSHGRQITWSPENYTGTHTGSPYYVTTALTGATSQCKQQHLKLIGCLKSIFNSTFWLFFVVENDATLTPS